MASKITNTKKGLASAPKTTAKTPAKTTETKPKTNATTRKELENLVNSMNKKFGQNAVNLGVPELREDEILRRIPTGSFDLDIKLGGGLPMGRFIEISGAYSSTKTTQCLHIVRNAQAEGIICAYVDVEGTTDKAYQQLLGIDTEDLIYSRPDSMEEACQSVLDMQRSGLVGLAVIDSIAAMSPNKEQDTPMDETMRMGIPQTLLGEFFRKFQANNNRLVREGKPAFTVIGINQLREKIGAYGDWLVA